MADIFGLHRQPAGAITDPNGLPTHSVLAALFEPIAVGAHTYECESCGTALGRSRAWCGSARTLADYARAP
jgi:hypothetical protein